MNNNKEFNINLPEREFVGIETLPHNEIKEVDATIILKDVPRVITKSIKSI